MRRICLREYAYPIVFIAALIAYYVITLHFSKGKPYPVVASSAKMNVDIVRSIEGVVGKVMNNGSGYAMEGQARSYKVLYIDNNMERCVDTLYVETYESASMIMRKDGTTVDIIICFTGRIEMLDKTIQAPSRSVYMLTYGDGGKRLGEHHVCSLNDENATKFSDVHYENHDGSYVISYSYRKNVDGKVNTIVKLITLRNAENASEINIPVAGLYVLTNMSCCESIIAVWLCNGVNELNIQKMNSESYRILSSKILYIGWNGAVEREIEMPYRRAYDLKYDAGEKAFVLIVDCAIDTILSSNIVSGKSGSCAIIVIDILGCIRLVRLFYGDLMDAIIVVKNEKAYIVNYMYGDLLAGNQCGTTIGVARYNVTILALSKEFRFEGIYCISADECILSIYKIWGDEYDVACRIKGKLRTSDSRIIKALSDNFEFIRLRILP